MGNFISNIKARPYNLIRWSFLIFYIGILYLMASDSWQNTHFFAFLAFIVLMPVLILVVFRVLENREREERASKD